MNERELIIKIDRIERMVLNLLSEEQRKEFLDEKKKEYEVALKNFENQLKKAKEDKE